MLITLSQAKAFMQITVSDYDDLITDYIQMVSAEIEAYTNRTFTKADYNEALEIRNSRLDQGDYLGLQMQHDRLYIRLRHTPVQTVTSVTQRGVTIDSDNYTVDTKAGIMTFYTPVSDYKGQLVANYTAGYDDPTVTTGGFIVPFDLQMIAKQGVKVMFENNSIAKQGQGDVKSKSLKDFSVSYGNKQTGLYVDMGGVIMKSYIAGNKAILDKYKYIDL